MNNKLKPCPFCGGKAKQNNNFKGRKNTWCSNSPITCANGSVFTVEEWNARSKDVCVKKLFGVLSDISGMCVGDIAMGYDLDAQAIGKMIFNATGLTQPELHKLSGALDVGISLSTLTPQNEWISVDGATLKYNALYHVLLKNKMIIVCRFNDYKSLGGHTNYWQDLNHNDISMDGTMFIEIATPTPPKEI